MSRVRSMSGLARPLAWIAGAALLLLLPLVLSPFNLVLARQILLFSMLAISLNLLWGRAGQLSFGQAVFFGLGAYTFGVVGKHTDHGDLLTLLASIALPMVVAAGIGYFLLYGGVRGPYFTIVTLALSLVATKLAVTWIGVTGGDSGLTGIPQFVIGVGNNGVALSTLNDLYYLAAVGLAVSYVIASRIYNSDAGLVLAAIRENEHRAAFCGYNTPRSLLVVFVVSAGIAGAGGALFAASSSFVAPDLLGTLFSTEVIVWVAIGGRGYLIGAVVGTAAVRILNSALTPVFPTSWPLIVGAFFVLSVLVMPTGIVGLATSAFERVRKLARDRYQATGIAPARSQKVEA